MIQLVEPCDRYLPSYREALAEYRAHRVYSYSFTDADACDIFEKFRRYRHEQDIPAHHVGAHYFWLVDDARNSFIGEICIRHRLTESLLRYGGHIGYGVRRSEWRKGYGTLMLRLALEEARSMGIARVLITCDDDNLASARVMEKNGFVLTDKVENDLAGRAVITRRYWKSLV